MKTNVEPQIGVVSVTSTSSTLGTLLGALSPAQSINASTKLITLVPLSTGIYMNSGTATSAHHPMLTSAHKINGGSELAKLQFWHASGASMSVIQEGG